MAYKIFKYSYRIDKDFEVVSLVHDNHVMPHKWNSENTSERIALQFSDFTFVVRKDRTLLFLEDCDVGNWALNHKYAKIPSGVRTRKNRFNFCLVDVSETSPKQLAILLLKNNGPIVYI